MILIRQRKDLLDEGLMIPVKLINGGLRYRFIDKWVHAFQPDELDGSEFNIILLSKNNGDSGAHEVIGTAISVDFEFRDMDDE